MDQLIEAIRGATTSDATPDQKAAGVQACRAIIAALDTEPGKPMVLPGTPPQPPLAGISIDQVLELLVARLTMIVNTRDAVPAPATPNGLRIPAVVPPRSLARPATAPRASTTKRQSVPTRKP